MGAERKSDGATDGFRSRSFAETASPELAELAKTIGVKADATTVFGSPIVDGERTVVPVAFGMVVGLAIAMRLMRPRATIAR